MVAGVISIIRNHWCDNPALTNCFADRDRDKEFITDLFVTKEQLHVRINNSFNLVIDTIGKLEDEDLFGTQIVRGKERTTYEVLQQCATHYSEHLGQVLYIAKLCLREDYITTSIYKSKP
ncbi:DUF1572 domain-containing protein [Rhodococcus hoagii]|nr:DUF1572 domain-containing protein [Prescottella equi]NKR45565.1 DUF1572 domain-containing protein [Prescottella equi]NKT61570.1 DUF1572 domain-containing protein [Prescottella equi]HAQ3752440.1 DUF1572 domain-containing protein [Enterococcus faecium]HAQ3752844.1 DUF1572 domain-containing protein [Enterococcus faecium]